MLTDRMSALYRQDHLLRGSQTALQQLVAERLLLDQTVRSMKSLKSVKAFHRELAKLETARVNLKAQTDDVLQLMDEMVRVPLGDGVAASRRFDTAWGKRVRPWMLSEKRRQVAAMRVQGRRFEIRETIVVPRAGGLAAEGLMRLVDELNKILMDPESRLDNLWRFFIPQGESGGTLWLYQHRDEIERKHECLFFRIEVVKLPDDRVGFELEAFVPVGFAHDAAQYPIATSNLVAYPEWIVSDVATTSYNATHTVNLNINQSASFGATIGRTLTDNQSTTLTDGTSTSRNRSKNESWGHTRTASTSDSKNRDQWQWFGFKEQTMTQNFGESFNEGTSLSESLTDGTNQSTATQSGNSQSQSNSVNESRTDGVSKGVSVASNNGLSFTSLAGGVDFSHDSDAMLKLYRNANPEAGRVISRVIRVFEAGVESVGRQLQQLCASNSSDRIDRRPLVARLDELSERVLLEVPDMKTQFVDVGAAATRGAGRLRTVAQAATRDQATLDQQVQPASLDPAESNLLHTELDQGMGLPARPGIAGATGVSGAALTAAAALPTSPQAGNP